MSQNQTNKGLIMSKVILNLDTFVDQQLTAQGVTDFVLDLKHVVGLTANVAGVAEVAYKVGNNPVVKATVTNSFDDLADQLITFNNDFFVATKLEQGVYQVPVIDAKGLSYLASYNAYLKTKRFLVNAKRLVGVAKVKGFTEITLKAPENTERKAYYIDVSDIPQSAIAEAIRVSADQLKYLESGRVTELQEMPKLPLQPTKFVIAEDFEEIASLVVDGAFDPEKD